jgi:hypothetical protein
MAFLNKVAKAGLAIISSSQVITPESPVKIEFSLYVDYLSITFIMTTFKEETPDEVFRFLSFVDLLSC